MFLGLAVPQPKTEAERTRKKRGRRILSGAPYQPAGASFNARVAKAPERAAPRAGCTARFAQRKAETGRGSDRAETTLGTGAIV